MDVTSLTEVILSTPAQDPFPPVRGEMENLVREVFGEGKVSGGDVAAAAGNLTIPAGYTISIPTREPGRSTLLRLTAAVVIAAVNNDELFATFAQTATGVRLVLDVAAATPSGSIKLGTATGTPVDTFAQDAATGGMADLVFDPDAIHDNVAAEVSALTEKATPVAGDHLLIEDSAAGNAKKRAQVGSLPSSVSPYAILRDEKASGTHGGASTNGSYETRDLNTEVVDEIGITLASNQFTLPAGTYQIRASAPTFQGSTFKAKLRNITDSTDEIIGRNARSGGSVSHSVIAGQFTIAASKTFEIQTRVTTSRAVDGLGSAATFGDVEVYTVVELKKVA